MATKSKYYVHGYILVFMPVVFVLLGFLVTAATDLPNRAGQNPSAIAIADFNGDGNLDVAVTDVVANTVTVALGKGDGHFRPPMTFPVDGEQAFDIAVADVNGDGIPDLIIANLLSDSISQLLGTGTGSFVNGGDIFLAADPFAVLVADVNADGSPDLAISESNVGLEVRLNDGRGNFNTITDSTAGSPLGLGLGHFGARQRPGLAVVTGGGSGAVGSLSLVLQKGRQAQNSGASDDEMAPSHGMDSTFPQAIRSQRADYWQSAP